MNVTWSLISKEKYRQGVFVNRVLRTASQPKKGGSNRKLQNEELHDFQFSPNSIQKVRSRRTKRTSNVACMVEKKQA
jgi:hypothetical protein